MNFIFFTYHQNAVAKKKSFQLFDSGDEDEDDTKNGDQQDADGIQFEKPQYEGKHGAKVR